jgi:hypothetical protein
MGGVNNADLVERLLEQNDRLMAALLANSPVEVIRALNPPASPAGPALVSEPFGGDGPGREAGDAWMDERVPTESLIPLTQGGWMDPYLDTDGGNPHAEAAEAES